MSENKTIAEKAAQYDALKRKHAATNEAVLMLEERIRTLESENQKLIKLNHSATENLTIQKNIVRNNIATSQQEKQALEAEILDLRSRLKKA